MASKKEQKVGFNRPLGGDVSIQLGGAEYSVRDIRARIEKDIAGAPELAGHKVNSVDIYVKPAEGMAYYVAHANGVDDVSGSVGI